MEARGGLAELGTEEDYKRVQAEGDRDRVGSDGPCPLCSILITCFESKTIYSYDRDFAHS